MPFKQLPKRHWIRDFQMESFLHKKVEEHRENAQAALDTYNRFHPAYLAGTMTDFKVFLNHRMFSTAGKAYTQQRMIEINYDLFKSDLNPETNQELANTLIHELCHLMVPKDHHGPWWQRAMLAFRLEPKRCHSMDTPKKRKWQRFEYTCPNCSKQYEVTKTKVRNLKKKFLTFRARCCKATVSTEELPDL